MTEKPFANFYFSVVGYEFQVAIKSLKETYTASSIALNEKAVRLSHELDDYNSSGEFIGERAEEGHIVWEQDDLLGHQIEAIAETTQELRKAYAIAVYHLWERAARLYTHSKADHSRLVAALAAVEMEPVVAIPELTGLWHLVNYLKHLNPSWLEKLRISWPEVTKRGAVVLSEWHMETVFNAAALSGPVGFKSESTVGNG